MNESISMIKAGCDKLDHRPDLSINKVGAILPRPLAPKMARTEAKSTMSLLPMDILREFVLEAYQEGVQKYEKESWRRGFKISELIDASMRHTESFFYGGEDYDPDSMRDFNIKKHHLAGAVFSLLSALHVLKYRPELDDRRNNNDGDPIKDKK